MKKTTKKVIALTAVLAMAASTSTMAFAESPYSNDDKDGKIVANDTQDKTTINLKFDEQFPDGMYTVSIPQAIDLTYDYAKDNWSGTGTVSALANDIVLKAGKTLKVGIGAVTETSATATLTGLTDATKTIDCTITMASAFEMTNDSTDTSVDVDFATAEGEKVPSAQNYSGEATFVLEVQDTTT